MSLFACLRSKMIISPLLSFFTQRTHTMIEFFMSRAHEIFETKIAYCVSTHFSFASKIFGVTSKIFAFISKLFGFVSDNSSTESFYKNSFNIVDTSKLHISENGKGFGVRDIGVSYEDISFRRHSSIQQGLEKFQNGEELNSMSFWSEPLTRTCITDTPYLPSTDFKTDKPWFNTFNRFKKPYFDEKDYPNLEHAQKGWQAFLRMRGEKFEDKKFDKTKYTTIWYENFGKDITCQKKSQWAPAWESYSYVNANLNRAYTIGMGTSSKKVFISSWDQEKLENEHDSQFMNYSSPPNDWLFHIASESGSVLSRHSNSNECRKDNLSVVPLRTASHKEDDYSRLDSTCSSEVDSSLLQRAEREDHMAVTISQANHTQQRHVVTKIVNSGQERDIISKVTFTFQENGDICSLVIERNRKSERENAFRRKRLRTSIKSRAKHVLKRLGRKTTWKSKNQKEWPPNDK